MPKAESRAFVLNGSETQTREKGQLMASGREVRMESSKIDLITHMLTVVMSLLVDAVNHEQPAKQQYARSRRSSTTTTEESTGDNNEDSQCSPAGVVSISPLLRAPIDPEKKYDLRFAATYLNLSEQTVRARIKKGTLSAELTGEGRGRWMITGEELIKHSNQSTEGDDQ